MKKHTIEELNVVVPQILPVITRWGQTRQAYLQDLGVTTDKRETSNVVHRMAIGEVEHNRLHVTTLADETLFHSLVKEK